MKLNSKRSSSTPSNVTNNLPTNFTVNLPETTISAENTEIFPGSVGVTEAEVPGFSVKKEIFVNGFFVGISPDLDLEVFFCSLNQIFIL